MASLSSSAQHRCVFVGNIPYDATEEQLIEICREVGPVVSFRLVIDRETGKPKGYGFCEYKDEETALSARRNLQGYEINGRQLRVDFAENDKNSDRSREQGRGGPGLGANVENQKQSGSSTSQNESSQPIGLPIALNAAAVMSGALGAVQSGSQPTQNALQTPTGDPLTLHLAKMSRSQLSAIISELKAMAVQNKEAAQQLLLTKPQLSKAVFQAQIMLGMISPQTLQHPNICQGPGQHSPLWAQGGRQQSVQSTTTLSKAPPMSNLNLAAKFSEEGISKMAQSTYNLNRASQTQNRSRLQPNANPKLQQSTMSLQSVVPLKSATAPISVSPKPQIHLSNNAVLATGSNIVSMTEPLITPGNLDTVNTNANRLLQLSGDKRWAQKRPPTVLSDIEDSSSYPSKMRRTIQSTHPPLNQDEVRYSDKQPSQLSPDTQSTLLQQVMKLTPEQLSLLPPEQRQQVIQLQLALRQEQALPL